MMNRFDDLCDKVDDQILAFNTRVLKPSYNIRSFVNKTYIAVVLTPERDSSTGFECLGQ